jgi:hypothetical protein
MRFVIFAVVIGALSAYGSLAAQNAASQNHRLIGGSNASVAAKAISPQSRLEIAGGSGAPVGISASPNTSSNSGQQSTQLPTDFVFVSGLEGT